MLSTNVLCIKKRKKRTYSFSNKSCDYRPINGDVNNKRSSGGGGGGGGGGTVTMLQITEDTPADMLAGAMDLTVHLPTGRTFKMAVERSTPMMDLLVQITTNHHLQISGYTLQVLGMAPSPGHSDKILPYKPNTPIGSLDTQHIRVVPKTRSTTHLKVPPPAAQPFESTFRLKVHLPRNQLYVTRVSQNILLEDIMTKVCEEKNLDPMKYELKHPGNLNEVLDLKLTLSDYQITEIFVVLKGTISQVFSSNDIMALRKEEERKQLHTKTGGGVFNLIFRRGGKSSMGSGSLSSENRSISPTHSDDSRSVTPPGPQKIPEVVPERPKPPQRKRRPAPKPPSSVSSSTSQNENKQEDRQIEEKKVDSTLTICHSRNSSDSSGYHEASVLSDHCNASLPRPRPKSMAFGKMQNNPTGTDNTNSGGTTTNLTRMASQSKSTSSLALPRRKKLAAPPPPPTTLSTSKSCEEEPASPLVASQTPALTEPAVVKVPQAIVEEVKSEDPPNSVPKAKPRLGKRPIPLPRKKCREEDTTSLQSFKSEDSIGLELQATAPTIIGFTRKTKETSPKEGLSRKNLFKIGSSLQNFDSETSSVNSTLTSNNLNEDFEELLDETIFEASASLPLTPASNKVYNELYGINDFESLGSYEQDFKSIKKWSNNEHLDDLSISSVSNKCGGASNSETLSVTNESLPEKQEDVPKELNELESWQYQLPSPPKAFRDCSPPDTIQEPTIQDSVITSPELFEKLKVLETTSRSIEESRTTEELSSTRSSEDIIRLVEDPQSVEESEVTTVTSDQQSVASEESILNKLSLENLEKRKSLVYNRELATSFKMNDLEPQKPESYITSLSAFEHTYNEVKRNNSQRINLDSKTSTLPNFKITTYDHPKQKIQVFEDDTIRSNTKSTNNKEVEYSFYKPPVLPKTFAPSSVSRSESFSMDQNGWSPTKPVSRSKSQLTLNCLKYKSSASELEDNLSKSNSLFDVSGLQSLEVIKQIQTKLNTPTSSQEHLDQLDGSAKPKEKPSVPRGAPAINMSTWSERPKVPVSVKEDADYKLGNNNNSIQQNNNNISSKLIVNTTNNNITSSNRVEVKTNLYESEPKSIVSVKINGSEPICSQSQGNVLIKIGPSHNNDNSRSYRRPFSDLNSTPKPRPHSIALDANFDVSRVPVVRAVELKKPFKDYSNTSITQINSNMNSFNKYPVKSFSTFKSTPTVKGFNSLDTVNNNRVSWSNSYGTLPAKNRPKPISPESFSTNHNVPFGQSNLRRTESSKLIATEQPRLEPKMSLFVSERNSLNMAAPPPPPPQPKPIKAAMVPQEDPRALLLSAIRDFGGKKGFRTVKT